jgi:hypothetical protein
MAPDEQAKVAQHEEAVLESGRDPKDLTLDQVPTSPEVAAEGRTYTNVDSPTIHVSEDKLSLYLEQLVKELSREGVIGPLGIFITLIVVMLTVDFNSAHLGIPADVLQAVFIVSTVLSFLWLAVVFIRRQKRGGPDDAIKRCLSKVKGEGSGVKVVD